jgi:hypothetical protein
LFSAQKQNADRHVSVEVTVMLQSCYSYVTVMLLSFTCMPATDAPVKFEAYKRFFSEKISFEMQKDTEFT